MFCKNCDCFIKDAINLNGEPWVFVYGALAREAFNLFVVLNVVAFSEEVTFRDEVVVPNEVTFRGGVVVPNEVVFRGEEVSEYYECRFGFEFFGINEVPKYYKIGIHVASGSMRNEYIYELSFIF